MSTDDNIPQDPASFESDAISHMDALYRMAIQLSGNAQDASDLVQETYLRAFRSADTFQDRGRGTRPWLFTILHNTFYSRVKRESRAPTAVEEFYDATSSDTLPDEPPPAWDLASFDWEHVDERIKAAIEDLSSEHRAVLLLWGVEGMKYREISEIVGVPIGTVMSRLHRARKIVAEAIEHITGDLDS
ncbi:MAG: RNA polymerase sigma factor [Planctomycetota bacterium]|jgi:RNA polymerase sigma-70 factor (ECF subfamily)